MNARCVLIVDVVESRRIRDFAAQRDHLVTTLSRRHRQRGWIKLDYAVTAWDEFQGLVETPQKLPWVLWDLWLQTHPIKLRVGFGGGAVERHGDNGRPLNEAVTGEAFFLAREALEHARSRTGAMSRVALRWNDEVVEAASNGVLRLIDALVGRFSKTQWQVISAYEELRKQSDVATALAKSESTISRSLSSAQYWRIRASLEDLEKVLSGLLQVPEQAAASKSPAC